MTMKRRFSQKRKDLDIYIAAPVRYRLQRNILRCFIQIILIYILILDVLFYKFSLSAMALCCNAKRKKVKISSGVIYLNIHQHMS